jgi:TetR/AcrR family transcriptional regulator
MTSHSTRPRPRPAAAARGAERILRGARRLFVRAGGAAFSARGVAKEAGVSLGAVQHFFRTKDALLAAMLEHVLGEFRREYDRLQQELPFNAEARLLGVIDLLVADVWREDSRKFFFGLFALSCHNKFAGRLVRDTYRHHQRRLAGFIGAARPHLSEKQCLETALLVGTMIDGLMVYTGPARKPVASRERLARIVRASVLELIDPAARG